MDLLSDANVQIDVLRECTERISDVMFKMYYNWRKIHSENNISEADAIAQCVLQIMNCKMRSFLKLSEGIAIIPCNESCVILDIPSLTTIVRSVYELAFVFHNIYIEQESEAEKEIVLHLWEIRGLNNRQGLSNIPEKYKIKEEYERKQIGELREKIRNIVSELNVSEEVKIQIDKVVKSNSTKIKGYKFKKDENDRIVKFEDFRMEDNSETLLKLDEYINVYRLWSVHAHPSYLGVLQFGQMFNQNIIKGILRTLLMSICKLSCTMIIDFSESIIGANEIFQELSDDEKNVVDFFCNRTIE